ncbi:MAG: ABC transporter permease [Clostridium sp.]
MKPLSYKTFALSNKRKVFYSMMAITIGVAFVIILYTFFQGVYVSQYNKLVKSYKTSSEVEFVGGGENVLEFIEKVKKNENVEAVIPIKDEALLRYSGPGVLSISKVYYLDEEEEESFIKNQKLELVDGHLPRKGKKEVVLHEDLMKNRGFKLGDKIEKNYNLSDSLPKEYEIVGVLRGDGMINIAQLERENVGYKGCFVFPKDGKLQEMNEFLNGLENENLVVKDIDEIEEDYKAGMMDLEIMDVISILSMVIMTITVGISKYTEFLGRREEIGVLNAIGYNKNIILKRSFCEVAFINITSFLIGLCVAIVVGVILKNYYWEPIGFTGLIIIGKGVVMAVILTLFTTLFTIIPINNIIRKLDCITIIERE